MADAIMHGWKIVDALAITHSYEQGGKAFYIVD